jgi:alpha-galactosidase
MSAPGVYEVEATHQHAPCGVAGRSRPKIAVIGAGSADFGVDCLAGIFRTPGLRRSQLALVDIDRDKLELAEQVASRLNERTGAEIEISATVARAEALPGADFVVLAVAVDREETWKRDHELALPYGISHYAENGGPGAFAHACRNLALVMPIVRDMERLCPSAHVLCLTNPLTRICSAINTTSQLRYTGICHGIGIGYWIVATAMHRELGLALPADPRFLWRDEMIEHFEHSQRLAKERYSIRAAGINHFSWILAVHDLESGEDVSQLVHERLRALPPSFEPLTRRLADLFGLIPVQSDTHISEYVPFASSPEAWSRYDIQLYDFDWARKRRMRHEEAVRSMADGSTSVEAILGADSERVEFVIDAIVHNRHAYEEALNVPNHGHIDNLPPGAVVEVPCVVGAEGVSGIHVGCLPEPIAALCRTQLTIADLNVRAFLDGDRDLAHQLLAIDPMVRDLETAVELGDEFMERHRDFLGDPFLPGS